jgi:hypothetical protein
MSIKYARIPGRNVLSAILQNIPIKCSGGRTTKTALKAMQCTLVVPRPRIKAIVKVVAASTKVYVLELHGGYIYVGQSNNVERRVKQHMEGRGAVFTKRHAPTGIMLPRLGNIDGAGDSGERQEVLLQMKKRGMHFVRGWKYVNNSLSATDVADIQSNWVEMFNLCRICMGEGHMASSCKKKKTSKPRK